jgi:nucleoside-diphosphate-sugar epimerase
MKLAVMGGTGLIGSQVVKMLNAGGHEAVPQSPSTEGTCQRPGPARGAQRRRRSRQPDVLAHLRHVHPAALSPVLSISSLPAAKAGLWESSGGITRVTGRTAAGSLRIISKADRNGCAREPCPLLSSTVMRTWKW